MVETLLLLLQSLGEILVVGLLLYLLLFLFGNYTVVYKVYPSGRKKRIGYLWRIKGEYTLYDTILPLFSSSKIGFIKGYEVRPLVVNSQQNKVQKTEGTFTDDGNVNDIHGFLVGTCDDYNARKTFISAPNGDKIGYVSGSLKAKSDLTVRGAGFSVLQETEEVEHSAFDIRVGFKDLMLPAALVYAVLYYPFKLITESFTNGDPSLYILIMLLYYVLIGIVFYIIKYEKTMRNESINYFIGLIDRNVGVKWLNVLIIISAFVALLIPSTPIAMIPLFTVLLIGFVFNLSCFTSSWHLEEPSANWSGRLPALPNAPASSSSTQSTNTIKRTFAWGPILELKGIKDCKEELELTFEESDFKDASSTVRKQNPFRSGPVTSEEDLSNRAKVVLAGAKTADGAEETAIAKIINCAYNLCLQYGLADFEIFDLVLGFVQKNISYVIDQNSDSINRIEEYFRFASESLVDQEGDCDCKSVLAYRLFEKLGVDVDLVTVKSGSEGVYNHVAIVLKNKVNAPIPLPPEFVEISPGKGVYCESTGHGFRPGDIPKDVDTKSLIVLS